MVKKLLKNKEKNVKLTTLGFTLIELMAVITILVVLSLIIVPIIDKNVKKSKENMYNIQIENIRMAGENYYADNISLKPTNGNYSFVKLDVLIEEGYIDGNIKNPKTGESFTEEIYVQLLNDFGTYKYSVCPLEEDCENYEEQGGTEGGFSKVRDINPGIICGDGEKEDYYGTDICYINSVEDLVEFASMVNSKYTFTNKTVMLMNNLDIENYKSYVDPNITGFKDVNQDGLELTLYEELTMHTTKGFPSIGNDTSKFLGTFEGNGHIISNIYMDYSSQDMTGLFGYNGGIIRGLIVENTTIKGNQYTGGLVGYNVGIIQSCRFDGDVAGTNNVGLVTGINNNGSIIDVVIDGNVSATGVRVGGLAGQNNATIKGIYRSGSVSTTSTAGNHYTFKSIGFSSGGKVSVVSLDSIEVIRNTSVTRPTSTSLSSDTGYTTNEEGIKNIAIYEQVLDTYIGLDNNGDGYYYDYNSNGEIELYSIEERPLLITMSGSGIETSPYMISSYEELKQVSYDLSKYYKLNVDIDLSEKDSLMISSEVNPFTGTFMGNGKSINNLRIIGVNNVGLFGYNSGIIKGIRINNIYVKGYTRLGAISGTNNGTEVGFWISNDEVVGEQYTGGFVGYNTGNISSLVLNGSVSGTGYVGLVTGINDNGTIIDVVIDGNVSATEARVGGFAGHNNATIKGVYRSGSVSTSYKGSYPYTYKSIGFSSGGKASVVSLDSIKVTINTNVTTPTDTSLSSDTGYTTNEEGIKNIAIYEQVLDTYIGLDNNGDGYYYDYNSNGEIELYSIEERPLLITMSGSGTETSPYMISSYEELKQVSYDLSKYYKLNVDMDLNEKDSLMISSEANPFTGTFMGNGKSINNLRIIGVNNVGLFGYNHGSIEDLNVQNFNIQGYNNVGGLNGYNTGNVKGVKTVNINVAGYENVGSLVGYNTGNISSVKVLGNANGHTRIGLVAGQSYGGNVEAIVSGNVVGTYRYVGGLVGYLNNNGTLKGAYTGGSVTCGSGYVGKTVYNNGGSSNTISLDSITVNGTSTTSTSSTDSIGYTTTSNGINNIAINDVVIDTFVGGDNNNDGYYYDYDEFGEFDVYSVERKPLSITMSGTGTSDNPYLITTYEELKQASYNQNAHYKLNADIDLTDKNSIMLGGSSSSFTGVFDGNGYEISNLTLIGINNVGLFGYNSGTIKGLKTSNINVIGYKYVGVLTGYNRGNISSVKVLGNANGYMYIGLVAGQSYGGNVEAIASGNVVGTYRYVGGLVGHLNNSGTLTGAYINGSVTGGSGYVGKTVYINGGSSNTISLDSIKVNGTATTSTLLNSVTGYTTTSNGINNIVINDDVIDTFVGGDNNNDGYYYDYDEFGEFDVYSVERNPLSITMAGLGTSDSPYLITSYEELKQASYNQNAYYKLNADIDLTDKNSIMLGGGSNSFTGVFDGNGYEISNLTLIGINNVGLFGYNSGTIKGLKTSNINAIGYEYVGVLTGYNKGNISSVKVLGNANGHTRIGLIAGQSYGGTVEAIASGNVVGTYRYVGGLVGYLNNGGTLTGAYIGGSVTGGSGYVGKTVYNNGGSSNTISLDSIKVNGTATTNTSLTSVTGKTYSASDLLTSAPYETVGFNFTITDSLVNEYIWYFTGESNDILTFKKN